MKRNYGFVNGISRLFIRWKTCKFVTCLFFVPIWGVFSSTVLANSIDIVTGLERAPYIIENESKKIGFEIEVVTHLLKTMGYSSKFYNVPYGRSIRMFLFDNIDAVMTTNESILDDHSRLTDAYIQYQNVAISLKNKNIDILKIRELSKYSIASFQLSSKILGEKFALVAKNSPLFVELISQERQLRLLKQGKVDVLVMDINIFNHLKGKGFPQVNIAMIFPRTDYKLAFKDKRHIGAFNKALASFLKSEHYKQLVENYDLAIYMNR